MNHEARPNEAGSTIGTTAENQSGDTIPGDSGGVTSDTDSQLAGKPTAIGDNITNEDSTGSGAIGGGSRNN